MTEWKEGDPDAWRGGEPMDNLPDEQLRFKGAANKVSCSIRRMAKAAHKVAKAIRALRLRLEKRKDR